MLLFLQMFLCIFVNTYKCIRVYSYNLHLFHCATSQLYTHFYFDIQNSAVIE